MYIYIYTYAHIHVNCNVFGQQQCSEVANDCPEVSLCYVFWDDELLQAFRWCNQPVEGMTEHGNGQMESQTNEACCWGTGPERFGPRLDVYPNRSTTWELVVQVICHEQPVHFNNCGRTPEYI